MLLNCVKWPFSTFVISLLVGDVPLSAHSESFFLKSQGPFSVWPQPSSMQMMELFLRDPLISLRATGHHLFILPGLVFPCSQPFRFSLHVVEEVKRNESVFGLSQLLTIPQTVCPCFSFCCRFLLGTYKPGRNKRELILGSLLSRVRCWYRVAGLCPWGGCCRVCLVPSLNSDFSLPVAPETVFQKLTTCIPPT